ncbi:MAG: ABC transporter permease subunit [Acidobacteria bacterium]|jgi:ABC-type transport system involved in cytochrome c biogenesis ATPase subunit|nr:ABC transporter permease subunit [Acidobacteriota bacterium]
MTTFLAFFVLELKRFITMRKLFILIVLTFLSLYSINKGINEFTDASIECEKFRLQEAHIFKDLMSYREYSNIGVGVFFLPSPAVIFFTNPPKTSELIGRCNSIARLDIDSSSKDKHVTRTDAPFPLRFSTLVLLIGTLATLFMGYDILRKPEYLKFLSANAGNASAHKIFFYIFCCRFIFIAFSFLAIFLLMIGVLFFHNISLTALDFPGLFSYIKASLLMLLFFFFAGFLAGNFRRKGTGNTLILGIWITFVIFIPSVLDSFIFEKSAPIPSPYELFSKKLQTINDFEKKTLGKYGKVNRANMETERKIIEGYWQKEFKEIETQEDQYKNNIEQVLSEYNFFSLFTPTTFYNLTTGEASSRGFDKYRQFYSYMQETWRNFVRFWIDRVYYNDPKQMINFIKGEENIFKSHSNRPTHFYKGMFINFSYLVILYIFSTFLFKRKISRLKITKQELAALKKLYVELDSSDLKIWLSRNDYFCDILFNILSGNNKEMIKKGISGVMLINGTDHFNTRAKEPFFYICRPQHIPSDIKVKDLITYYARVKQASRDELNEILNSPAIKPISRLSMGGLEGPQEFQVLAALLQMKRKQVYLIDNLSTGYPAECAIRLKEQIETLCNAGAIVILILSTVTLPESNKITGAYDDGMHWLYAVEERKAIFETGQKIQRTKN